MPGEQVPNFPVALAARGMVRELAVAARKRDRRRV